MITGAKRTRLRPLGRMALSQGLGSKKMPSQHLIGRYPFTGEDGQFPDEEATELEMEQWAQTGAVTLPGSLFAAVGEGPFFDSAGTPLPVMLWQWNDWVIANGQPPHVWAYRGWLYVYDIASISSAVIDKCTKITKATETTDALLWGVGHNGGLTSFRGANPLFNSAGVTPAGDGTTYAQNVLPVDKLGRGVWNGPGFTNLMPTGSENLTTWGKTSASVDAVYDGFILTALTSASCSVYKIITSLPIGTYSFALETIEVLYGDGVKLVVTHSGGTTVSSSVGSKTITFTTTSVANCSLLIGGASSFTLGDSVKVSKPMLIAYSYINHPYILPGTSVTSCAGSTTNGLRWLMDSKVLAALSGTKCTAAALVYMGVGSLELLGGTFAINTLSCAAKSNDTLFCSGHATVDSSSSIVASYDNTIYSSKASSWSRDEIHLKFVQVNIAGTQFRVGNKRYTSAGVAIDSAPQYSSWATYDGSFNPLTYLIAGYGLTVPQWIQAVQVWKQPEVDFTVIEKWAWRLA